MRTVILAVLSTSTLAAFAAIAAQGKLPQQSRHALVVARVKEPRNLRRMRTSSAQIEDALRRAAIYERSVALHADDPVARYEAMVARRLPMGSSMSVDVIASGTRDAQQNST
jgi:hypothetical protein